MLQVMACRLFDAKPLPEPMLSYCQLGPSEQTLVKLESKYETFHSWNALENAICEMAAILSMERWVLLTKKDFNMEMS